MTHEAVGLDTKRVYVIGTKSDCFRELHKRYPSVNHNETLYLEPLIIRRKK